MKRLQLRSKDVSKELEKYSVDFSKKDQVEVVKEEKIKLLVVNKEPAFFWYNEQWVPTLKFLQRNELLKKIIIDMGAVKFIVNGADIMRPGITDIEEGIAKNDFVVVIDKNNRKPLAVGIALYGTAELKALPSGKAVKNIHYVGDEVWKTAI